MKPILISAAIATFLATTASAQAAPIVSEDFSAGFGVFSVEGNTIATTIARPGYMMCCGVTGSDAAVDNPFVVFGSGNVENRGSMFTEFQTAANALYTLTFRAGAFGGDTTNLLYAVGGIGDTLTLLANNDADATWQTYSFNFVGTGTPTRLSFSSRGPGVNIDAILDDVSVTAALPEPATWALMILGFGGIGFAMRRKPNASVRIRFA